jgi:hypothetical protein
VLQKRFRQRPEPRSLSLRELAKLEGRVVGRWGRHVRESRAFNAALLLVRRARSARENAPTTLLVRKCRNRRHPMVENGLASPDELVRALKRYLDAIRRCLVSCYPRHRLQSFWRLEISIALNFVVRLYGLDGIVRHSPILAACRIPRIALDYIWRPRLHLRNRVLLGEASPIQPLDLAPFRKRGNSLSFLRRPLVCRVGRGVTDT